MSWLGAFIVGISLAAPAPGVDCGAFERSIDDSLKSSAMAEAGTIGDDSAPRQTNTELKVANELHLISLNLELMKAAGCPLPKKPLSGSKYLLPAIQCQAALRQSFDPSGSVPPVCDQTKWQPTGSSELESGAAAASPAGGAQVRPPLAAPVPGAGTVTLAKFQEISTGMTYEQVAALIEAEGSGPTSVPEGASMTDVYIWSNGSSAANMRVGFQNGKVVWKTQTWLD